MKRITITAAGLLLLSSYVAAEPALALDRAGYDTCIATYVNVTHSNKAARWLAGTCARQYLRARPVTALDRCFKTTLPTAQNDTAAIQRFRYCQQRQQRS